MDRPEFLLSNEQLLNVFALTKTATAVHVTEDAIIQMANDAMLKIWDKDKSVIGKSLADALPELKGQPFIDLFKKVWNEGITISGTDTAAVLNVNGTLQTFYFDFEYRAIKNEAGKTYCILHTAVDVTERYLSKQREQKLAEELSSINEELFAANEELRAANEELLQSRESLILLNRELDERVEQRTKALTASEAMFRGIFEQSPLALCLLGGRELIIESANHLILQIWGKTIDVIGKPLAVALPELKEQPFLQILDEVYTTGESYYALGAKAIQEHNGEMVEVFVDFVYSPLNDEHNKIKGIMVSAVDVTQRELSSQREQQLTEEVMAANEELTSTNEELSLSQTSLRALNDELEERVAVRTRAHAESEARLKYMLADAPVAIAIFSGRDMIVESANNMVLEAWGKTSEVMGKPLRIAVPELEGQEFLNLLDEVFTTGVPFYGNEVKALLEQDHKMEEVYSNFVYHPVKDENGETFSIVLVALIVTEQVKARKKLEEAQDTLKMAMNAAGIGTWTRNLQTNEIVMSDRTREIHGIPEGHNVTLAESQEMIIPEHRERIMKAIDHAVANNSNFNEELTINPMDGSKPRWLRSSGKAYYDEQGKPVYITGTILDITEQVQDDMRKNDFIGMASHELKTPLTSLSAIVQMLHIKSRSNQDNFTANALEKASTQVRKMTAMINGFLNVSRLESGKIHLDKEEFDLQTLVTDVIDETKLTVISHTIAFYPGNPVSVYADRDKIGSVISNLLSNAVKYSVKGKNIEVRCGVEDGFAWVSVKDEGIGIKQQEIEKLFDRYYRVESSNTQHISGFGIGLYLSAEIIRRHEGRIWAESELGLGSTFYFSLPLSK